VVELLVDRCVVVVECEEWLLSVPPSGELLQPP